MTVKQSSPDGGALRWMTTYPSGRAHTDGYDQGQTGWRLHLVRPETLYEWETYIKGERKPVKVLRGPALCGMRPGTGWGMDLFIRETCARCEKYAEKRGINTPEIP